MYFRDFKNYSIRWKSGMLLVILAALAIGNFALTNYFQQQHKTATTVIDIAERNCILSQKIGLIATSIAEGKTTDKQSLKEAIELHQASLLALKLGGTALGIADNMAVPETSSDIIPTFIIAEELWQKYQQQAKVVVEEPTYINTTQASSNSADTTGTVVQQQVVRMVNPEVAHAAAYIEQTANEMLTKNMNLLDQYKAKAEHQQASFNIIMFLSMMANLAIVGFFFYIITKHIINPVNLIERYSLQLAEGDLSKKEKYNSEDELGKAISNMNLLNTHLGNAAQFAENIGKGIFTTEFKTDSEEDLLGKSLLEMRSRLLAVAEEDKKRSWVSEGLAQFATILQQDYDTMEMLGSRVIASLIHYMNANQGGLFLANTDVNPPQLELTAMYAWGKKKYIQKQVMMGEDMLGQAWQEQAFIYLTEVPEDYVDITSGIGKAKPRSILIVPLKLNEEVFGMIEMASFQKYDAYELDFVQKVAERIAATVSTARTNYKTRYLLEQSQQQAEEMRAQEEEVRQNLEELAATQEEMERNQLEMGGQLAAINASSAYIEFNLNGEILKANNLFLSATKYHDLNEIIGKHHRIFMLPEEAELPSYKEFWQQLRKGITQSGEFKRVARDGSELWLLAYYTPVLNSHREPIKIIKLATDITAQKLHNLETQGKIHAITKSNAVIEFDLQGRIIAANNLFLQLMEYDLQEVQGKHHSIFVGERERQSENYQMFWKRLAQGEYETGEFRRFTKSGREIWVRGSYNAILDLAGNPVKVIKFAQDITEEKKLAVESQEIAEQLAAQEEELRQNLEELQATQEEVMRQMRESEYLKEELVNREIVFGYTTILSEADTYGTITHVNEKLCEVSKYSKEELIGKPHNIFRHPDMPKALFKLFWQTIKQGGVFKGIIKNMAKDGSHYWVDSTIVPVKDSEGKIVKYIGARYHITDDQIAEQLYAKQAEALGLEALPVVKN